MLTTTTLPGIHFQDRNAMTDQRAVDFKLDTGGREGFEVRLDGDYPATPKYTIEKKVEVESYLVGWDGRRRYRFVKWYRVLVDGKAVAYGLKRASAYKLAKELA